MLLRKSLTVSHYTLSKYRQFLGTTWAQPALNSLQLEARTLVKEILGGLL